MLHPDTELRWIDDEIGFGVFATRRIPRGTVLWALDPLDQRIPAARAQALCATMGRLIDKYTFRNRLGEHVLCWDHGRFMNHACEAASLSPGVDYELAVRDLAPGDEVTCDYGALNLEAAFGCLCGAPRCRGIITPDDFDLMVPRWDARLRAAVADAASVPQPLLPFLAEPERFEAYAKRPETLPSSALHRLRGAAPAAEMLA